MPPALIDANAATWPAVAVPPVAGSLMTMESSAVMNPSSATAELTLDATRHCSSQ